MDEIFEELVLSVGGEEGGGVVEQGGESDWLEVGLCYWLVLRGYFNSLIL
jgi:hypothetical protein